MRRIIGVCGIFFFLGAMMLLMAASLVRAHGDGAMNYPPECCAGYDCAPVEKSEVLKGSIHASLFPGLPQIPSLWIKTKHGSAIVPQSLVPRQSQDHRMHACIRQGQVVCLFLPPSI